MIYTMTSFVTVHDGERTPGGHRKPISAVLYVWFLDSFINRTCFGGKKVIQMSKGFDDKLMF